MNFRFITALRALTGGVRSPGSVPALQKEAAMACFAIAVFLVSLVQIGSVAVKRQNMSLATESARIAWLNEPTAEDQGHISAIDGDHPFTRLLGETLIKTIVPFTGAAVVFMVFMPFLTNVKSRFLQSLAAVSATALIEVLGVSLETVLQLSFGTTRAGLHAAVVVDPQAHPLWFFWLQNFSLYSLWQFLAAGAMLTTWSGLHWRYGVIVGGSSWIAARLLLGVLALMAWLDTIVPR